MNLLKKNLPMNLRISYAYSRVLESESSIPPEATVPYYSPPPKARDRRKVSSIMHNIKEREKLLTPAETAMSLSRPKDAPYTVVSGSALSKLKDAAISAGSKIRDLSTVVSLTNGRDGVYIDISYTPWTPFDSRALSSLKSYISKYAPWLHEDRTIEEGDVMLVRYLSSDKSVLNSYRKLNGLDRERTDFVQPTLF